MKGMEELDRDDLINWDTRDTRGHGKKIKRDFYRRDIKKNRFPHRVTEAWNGLQKDGDIIEKGNHDELLKENGFYAELYNSQFETVE